MKDIIQDFGTLYHAQNYFYPVIQRGLPRCLPHLPRYATWLTTLKTAIYRLPNVYL